MEQDKQTNGPNAWPTVVALATLLGCVAVALMTSGPRAEPAESSDDQESEEVAAMESVDPELDEDGKLAMAKLAQELLPGADPHGFGHGAHTGHAAANLEGAAGNGAAAPIHGGGGAGTEAVDDPSLYDGSGGAGPDDPQEGPTSIAFRTQVE